MIKPQKCIICKGDFWFKRQGRKPYINVKIRQGNCKTCSRECAKIKSRKKINDILSHPKGWSI